MFTLNQHVVILYQYTVRKTTRIPCNITSKEWSLSILSLKQSTVRINTKNNGYATVRMNKGTAGNHCLHLLLVSRTEKFGFVVHQAHQNKEGNSVNVRKFMSGVRLL